MIIEKDLEGDARELNEVLSRHLPVFSDENHENLRRARVIS
jgi:hypothetical protein